MEQTEINGFIRDPIVCLTLFHYKSDLPTIPFLDSKVMNCLPPLICSLTTVYLFTVFSSDVIVGVRWPQRKEQKRKACQTYIGGWGTLRTCKLFYYIHFRQTYLDPCIVHELFMIRLRLRLSSICKVEGLDIKTVQIFYLKSILSKSWISHNDVEVSFLWWLLLFDAVLLLLLSHCVWK